MPPQSVVALKPGDVVGDRYEIVRLIGEGGMGAVFEAKHRILGRAVAVKVLKPEIARQETFAARFLVEAKAAAELHHRNIVELTDYGVDGDRPYMVMEILRGESLAALLHREGALSMQRVVALIDPVLRALAMAHARGVVHRDIKPENIFLGARTTARSPRRSSTSASPSARRRASSSRAPTWPSARRPTWRPSRSCRRAR